MRQSVAISSAFRGRCDAASFGQAPSELLHPLIDQRAMHLEVPKVVKNVLRRPTPRPRREFQELEGEPAV